MNALKTPKGLGRGLDVLLGGESLEPTADAPAGTLPISVLQRGKYQPRGHMDDTALAELAQSIRQHGIMQPLVVRALSAGRYEIIAGERRFRAAQIAGLTEVPVLIRQVTDQQALALALIENIQREDLNALEQARAIKRLIDEFGYTHEQAADAIGRSRSATSNLLRLLNLAEPVQAKLLDGVIEMGHARALLATDPAMQIMLANEITQRALSVRETEALVSDRIRRQLDPAPTPGTAAANRVPSVRQDPDLARLQTRIADLIAAPVELRANAKHRGSLTFKFANAADFDALMDRLGLAARLADE